MPIFEKIDRFARMPLPAKWAAIKAASAERLRLYRLLVGRHGPPNVLQSSEKLYFAHRPAADVVFKHHPEIGDLSKVWIKNNARNNADDLPRFYALILNIKQILGDGIEGEMAELGVYKGNSAAVLAHYARLHERTLYLFDTFEGFDSHDFVGIDQSRVVEFADTSLSYVRDFVGEKNIRFVSGRFPYSLSPDIHKARFCIAHIDCDLYEPAKAALEFFYPHLSPGGLIILHDYANPYWDGIKRAVDEYCLEIPEKPVVFGDKAGTVMIRKSTMTTIAASAPAI
jgi:hypothetical protein